METIRLKKSQLDEFKAAKELYIGKMLLSYNPLCGWRYGPIDGDSYSDRPCKVVYRGEYL